MSRRQAIGLALLLWPALAAAQLPVPNCPIPFLSCGGGGVAGLNAFFWGSVWPSLKVGFVGVALCCFLYYSVQLMMAKSEESNINEAKSAYEMAIFGCAVVILTAAIVESFAPSGNPNDLVRPAPLITAVNAVIFFMKLVLGAIVLIRLTIQGIRLILLEGQSQGETDKQKKQFFNGIFGVAAILLANALVAALYPGANSGILAIELVGMANFLLVLMGGFAVITIIIAGFMLILSVDESLKDRAKKVISGTVIALTVVLCAYVLVNFFLAL